MELPADQRHAAALRLVPDSGAEGFVIFERDGRTAIALQLAEAATGVISLNGRTDARAAVLRELHVGDATIKGQRAVILERDRADLAEGDGLLPLHVFASVSFNSRERYFVARAH
ncbi:MAG TPA: aspartyl protease family protein [Vicinamibacterales bacterium]|nr:aspartyl protease family protein [Vicinamibacterales bacterium]